MLLRIDPAGNSVVQAVSVGNGPVGVAVGDNAVWVANTPDRTISRVDPTSGSMTKINLPDRPREVAYADDLLWASTRSTGRSRRWHSLAKVETVRTVEIPRLSPPTANIWTLALTSSTAPRDHTPHRRRWGGDWCFDACQPSTT